MKKAVFLDKDGTIIQNIPYNICLERITIEPTTIEGLRLLQKNGFVLIIITNQSGVEKGYFSEHAFIDHIHKILDIFLTNGIFITSYYYCPHDYTHTANGFEKVCICGKPKPGMIKKAAQDFSIDLTSSWMVGDILNDIEAGNRAFTKTILINNGNETDWQLNNNRIPTYTVKNFYEAARTILRSYA